MCFFWGNFNRENGEKMEIVEDRLINYKKFYEEKKKKRENEEMSDYFQPKINRFAKPKKFQNTKSKFNNPEIYNNGFQLEITPNQSLKSEYTNKQKVFSPKANSTFTKKTVKTTKKTSKPDNKEIRKSKKEKRFSVCFKKR